ncbi:RCC1 domain-containing protein [Microbotryomycetes sp. JL221]|nr:RCC1 domain-containing protein [Microbotryomycetes sp. JL221]
MPRVYGCGSNHLNTISPCSNLLVCNEPTLVVDQDAQLIDANWSQTLVRQPNGTLDVVTSIPSSSTPPSSCSIQQWLGKDSFTHWLNHNHHVCTLDPVNNNNTVVLTSIDQFQLVNVNSRGEFLGLIKSNSHYQIILYPNSNSIINHVPQPTIISQHMTDEFVKIKAGAAHFLLLTAKGSVYSVGDNRFNQLGLLPHEKTSSRNALTLIEGFQGLTSPVIDICCGDFHNVALTKQGDGYVFGDDRRGQCGGLTDETGQLQLIQLTNNNNNNSDTYNDDEPIIKFISCGTNHTVLVTNDNQVFVTGCNNYGQLGQLEHRQTTLDNDMFVRQFVISESLSSLGIITKVIATRNKTFVQIS